MELSNTVGKPFLCLALLLYMSNLVTSAIANDLCEFEKLSPCKSGFNVCAERSFEVQKKESTVSTITAFEQGFAISESTLKLQNTKESTISTITASEQGPSISQSTMKLHESTTMKLHESTTTKLHESTTMKLHESTKSVNEATTAPQCGPNMAYTTCTCRGSCQDPDGCVNICIQSLMCVCLDGFLINGADCVTPEQCGCYLEDMAGILLEGEFYVNTDCTRRAHCTNDRLSWDETYVCGSDATCETRDNVRQCYCNSGWIGDGRVCSLPTDCFDLYNAGYINSGAFNIKPTTWPLSTPFQVYCDMSDGGGWTVFQSRKDGSTDFYRNWYSYKEGFGSVTHEFWLGNGKLYYLTNQKRYTIQVDLVNTYGSLYYARYDSFRINSESDNYRLSEVGSYSGTADTYDHSNPAGYAFSYHLHKEFSTYDRDNDNDVDTHCAEFNHGAWWHGDCHYSNLNGDYHADTCTVTDIDWYWLPGSHCNLKSTQMKLRPF